MADRFDNSSENVQGLNLGEVPSASRAGCWRCYSLVIDCTLELPRNSGTSFEEEEDAICACSEFLEHEFRTTTTQRNMFSFYLKQKLPLYIGSRLVTRNQNNYKVWCMVHKHIFISST
jgi:hypothetical protein